MWNVIKQEMKLHVDVGLNWIDHNLKEMKLPTDTLGSGRDYDNCPAFLDKNDKHRNLVQLCIWKSLCIWRSQRVRQTGHDPCKIINLKTTHICIHILFLHIHNGILAGAMELVHHCKFFPWGRQDYSSLPWKETVELMQKSLSHSDPEDKIQVDHRKSSNGLTSDLMAED